MVAKLGLVAPLTPLPVVLYSAKRMLLVRSSPVFQTDQMALFRGAVTTVFLKMTLGDKWIRGTSKEKGIPLLCICCVGNAGLARMHNEK